jgi:hypothetical protein
MLAKISNTEWYKNIVSDSRLLTGTQTCRNITLINSQKLALMKLVFYVYYVGAEHEYDINPLNTELNPICQ